MSCHARCAGCPVDLACLKGLAYTIWGFIMFALVLEGLEFANIVYKGREGIDMIMQFVTGPLLDSLSSSCSSASARSRRSCGCPT